MENSPVKNHLRRFVRPIPTAFLAGDGAQHRAGYDLSMSDLTGALRALSKELKAQLLAGNRVHLPGLGFFSLAIRENCARTRERIARACCGRRCGPFAQPEREVMGQMKEAKICAAESTSAQQSYAVSLHHCERLDQEPLPQRHFYRSATCATGFNSLPPKLTPWSANSKRRNVKLINVGSKWHKIFQKGAL